MKKKQKKISTEVVRRKRNFKIGLFSGVVLLGTAVASIAATCVNDNSSNEIFRAASPTDYLANNSSPLNPTFTNAPISTTAQAAMISLLTYETTGNFQFDKDGNALETTKSSLKLEAAKQVELLDNKGNIIATYKRDGNIIDENDADVQQAQSEAVAYRFTIDTDIKWLDHNGIVKDSLSGKDFERGLETYLLSSDLSYNRNGYFIDLMGIDFNKTAGGNISKKDGEYVSVNSVDYDVNNYRNTDETFTLYLKSPYPYTLSILTKDFFNPLPHNNPYVQNIRVTDSNQPISIMTDEKGKRVLDQQNTNWDQIYGSGQVGTFLEHTWFAGAYYITKFSRNQIIFILNDYYMETVGTSLDQNNGKKIKAYLVDFGSGNPEVYYEKFVAKQISTAAVPSERRTEAISKFLNNGLYVSSIVKSSGSNYIAYTPKPYVVNGNEVRVNNASTGTTTISPGAAQMIYNWDSEDSTIIRTGISGLINHYQLSKLNIPTGDFQYSNIPYGVFDLSGVSIADLQQYNDYYKAIDQDKIYGGLPRKATDYTQNFNVDANSVFKDNDKGFTIPYYYYDKTTRTTKEKDLTVNHDNFIKALIKFGATANNPLKLQYKYGEASVSDNYNNYLLALKRAIESIGTDNGIQYLTFDLVNRNAPNPSWSEWYSSQTSSLGFSYWNPDYNAVGTWIEADATLDDMGLPSTNNHSIFGNLMRTLFLNAIDTNASFDSNAYDENNAESGKDFATPNINPQLTSTFANDKRFNEAFSGWRYSEKGIEFLNYLVENKVLNKKAVIDIVKNNPNDILDKLSEVRPKPETKKDLYPLLEGGLLPGGESIFNPDKGKKEGSAVGFSKYLGQWAGLNPDNALWLTITMDNGYSLLPRSESGIRDKIYTLVDPKFILRASSVGPSNVRDYGVK